jgi:putative oxidoreductase
MRAAADSRAAALIAAAYATGIPAYVMVPVDPWPVSTAVPPGLARLMVAFLMPSAAAVIYLLLTRLASHGPATADVTPLNRTYSAIVFAILLFVVALHAVVLIGLIGGTATAVRAVPVLVGLVLVTVGNLLPRTRPNLIVGIRTPATMADRQAWMRLHRFAGYVAVTFGAVLIASAFVPPGRPFHALVSAAAAAAVVALSLGYLKYSGSTVAAPQRSRIGLLGWAMRAPVVLIFLYFGAMKFPNHPESPWPGLFAEIGLGQWFRYFTGALEFAGAILLLVPRTTRIAAIALACTMAGAILTHIFIVGVSPAILLPIALLALLMLMMRAESPRLRQ